jgi:hypothetical protein
MSASVPPGMLSIVQTDDPVWALTALKLIVALL